MEKVDLKKTRRALFSAPSAKFVEIEVPELKYLMVDGHGDPNGSPDYAAAVASLYATAFAAKFAFKAAARDFVVAPLEELWSAADPNSFVERRKAEWEWTMMIMVPDFVTQAAFDDARSKALHKLGAVPESLRLDRLTEGLCLQALHIGSYDDQGPLLAWLHGTVMPDGGFTFAGPHHEIYLRSAQDAGVAAADDPPATRPAHPPRLNR